jgi:hypothetical protein
MSIPQLLSLYLFLVGLVLGTIPQRFLPGEAWPSWAWLVYTVLGAVGLHHFGICH